MLSSGIQIGVYSKLLDDTRKQMKDDTPSPKSPEVGRQSPIKEIPNYLKLLQQSEVKTSSIHITNDVTLHRNLHDLSGMTEMNQLVQFSLCLKKYMFYFSCANELLVKAKSYKYVLYRGRQKSFLHYFFSHLSIHESFLLETCPW